MNYLALLGWSHGEDEVLDLDRLVARVRARELSPSPAVFDLAKLDWLDHERIMALAPEEHERRFAERLPAGTPPQAAAALAAAFQPSLVRYGDAPAAAAEVLAPRRRRTAPRRRVRGRCLSSPTCARCAREAPEWLTPAGARDLLAAYRVWGKDSGIGARDLLMPLRITPHVRRARPGAALRARRARTARPPSRDSTSSSPEPCR